MKPKIHTKDVYEKKDSGFHECLEKNIKFAYQFFQVLKNVYANDKSKSPCNKRSVIKCMQKGAQETFMYFTYFLGQDARLRLFEINSVMLLMK